MPSPDHRRTIACLLVLCALPALLQWPQWSGWLSQNPIYSISGLSIGGPDPVLDGMPWVDGNAGATMQALGRGVVRAWASGGVPWWNHEAGVGLPLAAEMQPGVFFLPFIVLLGLFDGLLLLKIVLQAIAGVATYGLLRTLGLGRRAACLGGVLFQLNGTFAFFSDAPIMPAAFLPLLLLAVERCAQRARAALPGGWGLLAVASGLSVVACFPEMAYLDGLLALAWSLLRLVQLGPARWRFAARLAGGGGLAAMITLPAVLPFVQYLSMTAGVGHRAASDLGLQAPDYAMLLMPAVYGPPFWAGRYALWDTFVGGYLDLALVLLALLGLLQRGSRETGLRMLLGAWILVALLKVAGAPVVSPLLNHLPMMRMVQFFRYGQLGIDMAAVVLAAYALDAWEQGRRPARGLLALVAAIGLALCLAALAAARPTIVSLLRVPSYRWFLFGAPGWAALVALVLLGTLAGRPGPWRRAVLALALVLDASVLFSVPLLTGARNRALDLGGIAFLRSHLGLQRVYAMGPMGPNYGSFFGIASIDYNSVLIPDAWVGYVHRHLDPATDPAVFNGTFPDAQAGGETREQAFRRNQAAYAAIGVRYVLRPAGPALRLLPFGAWQARQPHPLVGGQPLRARIPAAGLSTGVLGTIELVPGLYGQHPDGSLMLRICQQDRCGVGRGALRQATDNTALTITLELPLVLHAGADMTMELRREGGSGPVAVWFDDASPLLSLDYISIGREPAPVYAGGVMRIDEVPGAAPYAAAPGCALQLRDRDRMVASCASPSHLTRLELDYPGWQASLNGRVVTIRRDGEIFQSVTLPAGRSVVRFAYQPPGEAWAWSVSGLGSMAACGFGWRRFRKRSR